MTIQRAFLAAAIVLFVAVGAGFSSFDFGTVRLSLLGFGLACFAVAHWT